LDDDCEDKMFWSYHVFADRLDLISVILNSGLFGLFLGRGGENVALPIHELKVHHFVYFSFQLLGYETPYTLSGDLKVLGIKLYPNIPITINNKKINK